ncbi:MAG: sarcosine oxidase subunit alpha family protein [Hyphomicrobiales bacterium]|nr:sarcosine oxidase subunit alpha family protein [Hyphomicrobiales bacterium]
MSAPFRLEGGGRIDRTRTLHFTFDGKPYAGFAGDTLASALLANGVHLVGRSFKYHRPRGIVAAGSDEPNALVSVGSGPRFTPNLRATQVELHDGLVAQSQNHWPSVNFDLGALNDLFSPLFPAGFYYKTFMWPKSAWKRFYEPKIRAMAGLGHAPTLPDPDSYAQRYAHCDALIIGAGPAGIAAALAAEAHGARVILCDEEAELGGSLLAERKGIIEGKDASAWLADAVAKLRQSPKVRWLSRTTAFGYFPHNMLGLAERMTDHLAAPADGRPRERLWQVRAKEVVLATGALERPLVFPDNDRPGIMLAGAARQYLTRYAVKPGSRAVVATAHDEAYRAALELAAASVEIAAIVDIRQDMPGPWAARARAAGLRVLPSTTLCATSGRHRVSRVEIAPCGSDGKIGARSHLDCDLVLMCGGFTPTIHLFSQARGKLRFAEKLNAFLPDGGAENVRCAGACRGIFGLESAIADGVAAGEAAARDAVGGRVEAVHAPVPLSEDGGGGRLEPLPNHRSPHRVKAFVDFQNDVTAKDVKLAVREGFRSIEHIKRYTTTGMATDQGKTSNMNALGIAASALDKPLPTVGLTTFRMPYTPVTFGAFAGSARGELFDPVRVTSTHEWAKVKGAVFEDVGQWKRARYFPVKGEDMQRAVARECQAVRQSVGLFDGSTLGKIEIVGPDAAEFMNRIYVNPWTKLEPGRCRYGVMLREDGSILDDGVVGRLGADRFHVTTTTGGAVQVLNHMEDFLQTEWSGLDCWLTSTTEQWAVIAVQGPESRKVLERLVEDIDLSSAAMPHMSVRQGHICGVPTRLFRVSFTGELGFEINVPADYGRAIWEAVFDAGFSRRITPYGTEAMHVMRAEKGYIIVGQDTDGTVTADDVGLSWAIGKAKKDFVGKRSLARPAMTDADRKQLVGLLPENPELVLEEGAQIVADRQSAIGQKMIGRKMMGEKMIGHVTSSYFSVALGRGIALAMVAGGRRRMGETLCVPMPEGVIKAVVTNPVFLDPEGKRLDA